LKYHLIDFILRVGLFEIAVQIKEVVFS